MDSYTVKAILSAVDKGFTSTMKQAEQTCSSLSNKVKSGLGFGVLTGIGSQAFSSLTNGVSGLVSEMNSSNVAWKVFEGNMDMLGKGAGEIQNIKTELQDFAQASIYSASDMASTYSQLAAVGTKNCTQLVKGFGGLAAAAENPAQAMKTLSQQATQMAAKPYVQWMDFKLMLEQTPAGIAAVAKEMGKTTSELVSDVQKGTVKTEEFFDAITKVGTNDAFTKLATTYKSTDQAMDGLVETMSNSLQPAWKALDQIGIEAVSSLIDAIGSINVDALTAGILEAVEIVKSALNTVKEIAVSAWSSFVDSGAVDAAKSALSSFKDAISNVVKAIKNSGIIEDMAYAFGEIAEQVANAAKNVADFVANLDEGVISGFAKVITGVFTAFAGYKVVKSATNSIKTFTDNAKSAVNAVKNLYKKIKNGGSSAPQKPTQIDPVETANLKNISSEIKARFEGIANVVKSVGESIKTALEGVGNVFKSVGTAIADAAKGIGEGIKSALEGVGTVIESIGAAIKSVLEGLAPVIESLGTALATVAKGIGEGISIALQGLGTALASIPATTWLAIGAAALMFGAALALVGSQGEGLQMVLNGVASVISSIAPIVQIVVNGIVSAMSLLPGIFISVGAAIQMACSGISNVVLSLGTAISNVVTSISDGMSQIIDSVGNAISSVLDSLAGIIDSIGNAALNAGKGFNLLANGISKITSLNILDMGASLAAVATGLAGIGLASGGVKTAASAMKSLNSSINSISSAVTIIGPSFAFMASACSSAVNSMMSSLTTAASKAKSTGQQIGNNVINGVKSGMSKLPSTASQMLNQMYSTLNAAQSRAYQCGAFIGQGLANGLRSQVGAVQAAAAQLAAAADAAIRAKAKIGSPSKVADEDGVWIGKGLVNGLKSMYSKVWDVSEKLFEIPSRLAGPKLAFGGMNATLSDDYSYYHDAELTINVPLDINGREFAKATYSDYQKVGTEKTKLNNRLKGVK